MKKSGESSAPVKRRKVKEERMTKETFKGRTAKQKAQLDALRALPDEEIDTDDMPEVEDWSGARRAVFYRPVKQQITLRLDADLIDWFKRHHPKGEGYQTSINRALREYVKHHHSQL